RKLLRQHKNQWSTVTSGNILIEMLKYCIQDEKISDLEGLPLLPLADGQWVEFSTRAASSRYLVSETIFNALSYSKEGLVDIDIDITLVQSFKEFTAFKMYWSSMRAPVIGTRIKDVYQRLCYESSDSKHIPVDTIEQSSEAFPTNSWITSFWDMVLCLDSAERKTLLTLLEGTHVLPITRQRLAPLSTVFPVVYLDCNNHSNEPTLTDFLNVLEDQLCCRVMRSDFFITDATAMDYVFEVTDATKVLNIVSRVEADKLYILEQSFCHVTCSYMAKWLSSDEVLNNVGLRTLKSLPIYRLYESSKLVPLQGSETMSVAKWRVAWRFTTAENPWLPTSVDLLADEQPMLEHLTDLIGIPIIKASEYWYLIMSDLCHYPESDWDSMIEKFCSMYHVHSKDYDFISIMRNLDFVRAAGPNQSEEDQDHSGARLSPRSVVNPSLSQYYMEDEKVFPAGMYSRAPVFEVLSKMGMQTKFDASFILDRVHRLSSRSRIYSNDGSDDSYDSDDSGDSYDGDDSDDENAENSEDDPSHEERAGVLRALYARMNADFLAEFRSKNMQRSLRSKAWILAKSPKDDIERFYTTQECRPECEAVLVGEKMPLSIFDFSNTHLTKCMGWDKPPPLSKILEHFLATIERSTTQEIGEKDTFAFYEIHCHLLERIDNPLELVAMKTALTGKPWIVINRTLHTVDRVALKLTCDLSPHFVQVPSSDSRLNKLFLAMGVRETVGQTDLQGLISAVAARYEDNMSVSETDSDFVVKILQGMTDKDVKFQWTADILIPTADNLLCKITDVVYDD
ncbi:hypothetical protein BGZ65_008554, partial [Modicella reniformis]